MQDIYKTIQEYKPSRKYNALIVFDDMIAKHLSCFYHKSLSLLYQKILD